MIDLNQLYLNFVLPSWQFFKETIERDSAAWVALIVMIATIWQACIARKHNKLSVTPKLTIWKHEDLQNHTFKFDLINNGVGPAIIKSIRFLVDDKKITGQELEPYKKIAALIFPNNPINISGSYFSSGFMLPAEKTLNLVTFQFASNPQLTKQQFDAALERVDVIIRYQSIYKVSDIYNSKKIRKQQKVS